MIQWSCSTGPTPVFLLHCEEEGVIGGGDGVGGWELLPLAIVASDCAKRLWSSMHITSCQVDQLASLQFGSGDGVVNSANQKIHWIFKEIYDNRRNTRFSKKVPRGHTIGHVLIAHYHCGLKWVGR